MARELEQALDTAGLARAAKLVTSLERLDATVARWQELLDGAFAHVQELAQAARDYAAGIEGDPGRLAAVEQRRDELFRLMQKYGPALPDVLATRDQAAHELELLDTADLDLRAIAEQRSTAATEFARACAALTARRKAGAARLEVAVNELLPALGMPGGRFGVYLSPLPSPGAAGGEGVAFQVQLNVGLDARPLARVASGGELSRLMLALKVVLAEHDAVPTLVFDEVDQGIGGEVGGRVGEALAGVGRGRQALVITHLPQIAAYADHQLVVAKGAQRGVATSDVQVVRGDARTREWRACWATPTWTPRCAMRRSSSEQLPRSPKDDPIQRRGRHDPRAGDRLLDRKPALDRLAHVAQREPEPQPPLGRARVEHARGRGDAEAGGEIDRVLRAPERVVLSRLRPIAGREPRSQLRREAHERRDVHSQVIAGVPAQRRRCRGRHQQRVPGRHAAHPRARALQPRAQRDVEPHRPHGQFLDEPPLEVRLVIADPLAQHVVG